jgi:hypothetical protein
LIKGNGEQNPSAFSVVPQVNERIFNHIVLPCLYTATGRTKKCPALGFIRTVSHCTNTCFNIFL